MYRFQTMRKKLPSYAISFISKLETYIPKFGMYIPKFATYIPKFGMENSYGVKNFFQEGEIKISVALKKKQLFETTMLRFLTAIATCLSVTSCMGYPKIL